MGRSNHFCSNEIGNGPGDFEDAGISSCRKAQLVNGLFQQAFRILSDLTVFFYMPGGHLGVAVKTFAGETVALNIPGGVNPPFDSFRVFAGSFSSQIAVFDRRDLDVNVNTIPTSGWSSSR